MNDDDDGDGDNNIAYDDDSQNYQLLLDQQQGQQQHLSRWKSVPQILILPALVQTDQNDEQQQQAEMMVMQHYQIGDNNQQFKVGVYDEDDEDEDDDDDDDDNIQQQKQQPISSHKKQQLFIESNIDSGRIFPPTASPGVMIVNQAVDDHNLEDQLGQAIDGVNIDSIIQNQDDNNFQDQDNLRSGKNYQMIPSGVSTLNRLQEIIGGGVISNSDSRDLVGSSLQQSNRKQADDYDEVDGAKEFNLGFGQDGEQSISKNVHISTIIEQEQLIRQQSSLRQQSIKFDGNRNDESDMLLDNSQMDKSIEELVAPSMEGTDADIIPAINQALKEQKKGRQQQQQLQNLEKVPTFQEFKEQQQLQQKQQFDDNRIDLRVHQRFESDLPDSAKGNYINIIGDQQEQAAFLKQQQHSQQQLQKQQQQLISDQLRASQKAIAISQDQPSPKDYYQDEEQEEDEDDNLQQEEAQERQYFEDPEHQLDQFEELGLELPSIQQNDLYALRQQHENPVLIKQLYDQDYSNSKKFIQITPKPKLQIQITSPQNSAIQQSQNKNRAAALPPPVPRPRQLVPTLDLRKLSSTQQISQLHKIGSEELIGQFPPNHQHHNQHQFEMFKEVHPDTSAPNTMGRSMFERNFFQEFTESQRGNAISQRQMVRQIKRNLNSREFIDGGGYEDPLLRVRQLPADQQYNKIDAMMELQQQERKRKKYSERRILSLGSEFQSAAQMIYQTQQSTQRIHKIFSERGISSQRSRTISQGNLQNKFNNQQPYSQYTPNNLATKSARVSWRHHSSGVVGGAAIAGSKFDNNYQSHNKETSQVPENPFNQQQSQSAASAGYHGVGSYQALGSKLQFNQQHQLIDDDPYNQKSISGPRKSQPQPILTTEESLLQRENNNLIPNQQLDGDNINQQSPVQSSQEPKRGLSRTRSQDYLERRKINNYMKREGDYLHSNISDQHHQQQQHLRKPSPQMLQFFKQDKSIQEDMDDQTVAIIDNQQVQSPFNKKSTEQLQQEQVYKTNDILDPSQSQQPDDLYMEMMAGEINAQDLVRSTQKNASDNLLIKNIPKDQSIPLFLNQAHDDNFIGQQQQLEGRNLYQHTSDLIGRGAPTLLTDKQDFNKLHSVHDLKKTLDEVRKQTRSGANNQNFLDQFDEQNDDDNDQVDDSYLQAGLQKLENSNKNLKVVGDSGFASNYPNQLQRHQASNYDDLFGPGGLQSPRTIPQIDLHNLLLNSGNFSGTDKLKTVKAKTGSEQLQHQHQQKHHDKQFEQSMKSIEVLQHLQSDPHILLQDAAAIAGGRSRSGDIGTDEDDDQDYDYNSNNNKINQNSRSGDLYLRNKQISSASITPEQSKEQLSKDLTGHHQILLQNNLPKSTLPSPQIQKLPSGTDTCDLDDDAYDRINTQNNQRNAAQVAIELHSFNSLDELLQDQSGLKQKALDLISDQIFQAIVNRDLILAPYLFPDRQEESMIRASLREQQQNIESQNAHPPPALLKIAGVNTSFGAISGYLDQVIGEIVMDQVLSQELNKTLKQPIDKNPQEVLEQLQNSQIGSYSHFLKPQYQDEKEGGEQVKESSGKIRPPISKKLFDVVQEKIQSQQQEEEQKVTKPKQQTEQLKAKKEQIQSLVNDSKKMHSKMLFDSLNEALEIDRPYGSSGIPMPWQLGKKQLECQATDGEVKGESKIRTKRNIPIRQKLERAKQKVLMNSAFRAGVFPSMLFVHEGVFDEEEFSTERERRLAALLANEVIQSEKNWLQYGFEQAQVKIDLGDMILERLVTQSIYIMDGIEQNRIHQKLQNQQHITSLADGKSIFADGGFLQQQQELFQLTMSRSMNQNIVGGNQNLNQNAQNNINNNGNNKNNRSNNQTSQGISSDNLQILQNLRIHSVNQNNRDGHSPNLNLNTQQNTGGTCTVINNIESESPIIGNESSQNAFNGGEYDVDENLIQ